MATKENKNAPEKNGDPLSSFLATADRFTSEFAAQAIAAAGQGEDFLVIQSTAEAFTGQTKRLTDYIRDVAGGIGAGPRQELNAFLRVQDAETIVNRALDVSKRILSPAGGAAAGTVSKGFLFWIDEIMNFLKKIFEKIWYLIFHSDPPDWILTILQIIDEFLNLLKSLLGGTFGYKVSQLADEFSRHEVNFLREMTALAAWRAAYTSGGPADDEGPA